VVDDLRRRYAACAHHHRHLHGGGSVTRRKQGIRHMAKRKQRSHQQVIYSAWQIASIRSQALRVSTTSKCVLSGLIAIPSGDKDSISVRH
jgi:hypothetical protein